MIDTAHDSSSTAQESPQHSTGQSRTAEEHEKDPQRVAWGKQGGRPAVYGEAEEEAACQAIIEGASLNSFRKRPDLPSPVWVLERAEKSPAFAARLARARALSAFVLVDQALELTDTDPERIGTDGRADSGMIQHRRNQADLRKWLAAKFCPAVFGDKVEVEHTGTVQLQPEDVRAALVAAQARRGKVIDVEPRQIET